MPTPKRNSATRPKAKATPRAGKAAKSKPAAKKGAKAPAGDVADWRGPTLARMRELILEADPEMIEEDSLTTGPRSDSAKKADQLGGAGAGSHVGRWAAVLAAPVAVCAVVALLGSLLMRPIYAAEAELVFQPLQVGDVTEQYRSTQVVMVTGRAVLGPVAQALGTPFEELARSFSASVHSSAAPPA